jgi:hypothetical protein
MDTPYGHISAMVMEQYLAAGLPQSEALEVECHLEVCSDCRCLREVFRFWGELNSGW